MNMSLASCRWLCHLVIGFVAVICLAANAQALRPPAQASSATAIALTAAVPVGQPVVQGPQEVTLRDVLDTAKMLYEASKHNIEHSEKLLSMFAAGLAGIIAVVAFFIGRQFKLLKDEVKQKFVADMKNLQERHEKNFEERIRDILETSRKALEAKFEEELKKDTEATIRIAGGMSFVELAEGTVNNASEKNALYELAVAHFEKAITLSSSNFVQRDFARAYKAYVLKRLHRAREALAEIELAIDELERKGLPPSATYIYNAGCYANLCGDIDKALQQLKRACELDPSNKMQAYDDRLADWASVSADPRFLVIIGQAAMPAG